MDKKQMRVLFADEKEGKKPAMEEETRALVFRLHYKIDHVIELRASHTTSLSVRTLSLLLAFACKPRKCKGSSTHSLHYGTYRS